MNKLFTFCALIALTSNVSALPLLYTFTGGITNIEEYTNPLASNAGLSVGDSVTYNFLIDFDAPGLFGTSIQTDVTNAASMSGPDYHVEIDYFYAEYVGGSALNGGYTGRENFYGYNAWDVNDVTNQYNPMISELFGADRIAVVSSEPVVNWEIGQPLQGVDLWSDAPGEDPAGVVISSLELVGINPYPVIEPTGLFFMGLGLLLLLGLRTYTKKPLCSIPGK